MSDPESRQVVYLVVNDRGAVYSCCDTYLLASAMRARLSEGSDRVYAIESWVVLSGAPSDV